MTKSTEPSTPSGSSETQQRRRQITSYKNTTTSPATDRAAERSQRRLVQPAAGIGKAAEDHRAHRWRLGQPTGDGTDRDLGRPIGGKAINAGGDGGVSDRGEPIGLAKLEPAP